MQAINIDANLLLHRLERKFTQKLRARNKAREDKKEIAEVYNDFNYNLRHPADTEINEGVLIDGMRRV